MVGRKYPDILAFVALVFSAWKNTAYFAPVGNAVLNVSVPIEVKDSDPVPVLIVIFPARSFPSMLLVAPVPSPPANVNDGVPLPWLIRCQRVPLYISSPSVLLFVTIRFAAGLAIASRCAVVCGVIKTPFVVLTTSKTALAAASEVVPTANDVPILCTAEYSKAVPAPFTRMIDFALPSELNPVPPLEVDSCPVQPRVKDTFLSSETDGEPPSVSVTLVSSVLLRLPASVC